MSFKEQKMYNPKVSIVIPAYKAANYLGEAIESALAQTYKNIEIIVVNDGSPDDGATREAAMRYSDKICYYEKPNGGSSSALNYGISHMTGEWFSWLSHDDLYYPEKVEQQILYLNRLMEQGENVEDFVLFASADLIDAKGNYIRKSNLKAANRLAKYINELNDNCFLVAEGGSRFCFHGCSCLVHKTVFKETGGFHENLRLVNDIDMWKRIFKAGYSVRYLPEALVMGRMHSNQVSASIGFSYHNPEQDGFWQDSLHWLLQSNAEEYNRKQALYLFACSAYSKTRFVEGDRAFHTLSETGTFPETIQLFIVQLILKSKSSLMSVLKVIYRKLFVLK